MRRIPKTRRSRALAWGLLVCAFLAGPQGQAGPNDKTECAPTVCATAGSTIAIRCDRPDRSTVQCEAEATIWGAGRANANVGLPGTLEWRAEGRCRVDCESSQLLQAVAGWDGLVRRQNSVARVMRFPKVVKTHPTQRVCITYTAGVVSYSEATTATVGVHLDRAEAAHNSYAEVIGFCSQV